MLKDVVDAVRAYFVMNCCPAVVLLGNEHIAEHAVPPRVVFIASKRPDKFLPPLAIQAVGTMPQTVLSWQTAGNANPRAVRRRVITTEVHIWANAPDQLDPNDQGDADQIALDALINQTVLALHKVGAGNDQFVDGTQVQNPNHVRLGLVYVLNVTIEVPVVDVLFPPGVIDECVRTWPVVPADAGVTVEQVDADDNVIASVNFVAGAPPNS